MPVRVRFRHRIGGMLVRVELGCGFFCFWLCSFCGLYVRNFGVCFQRIGFRNLSFGLQRVGFCSFGKRFSRTVARPRHVYRQG